MNSADAIVRGPDPYLAAEACAATLREGLGKRARPDWVVAFCRVPSAEALRECLERIQEITRAPIVVGATCASALVSGRDEDATGQGAAVAALAVRGGPRLEVYDARLDYDQQVDAFEIGRRLRESGARAAMVLACPERLEAEEFLRSINEQARGVPIFGGIVSAASNEAVEPAVGSHRAAHPHAAVVLGFSGAFDLEIVVTHSCDPLGEPEMITEAQGTVIRRLGRRTALEVLRDQLALLPAPRQQIAAQNLAGGLLMDPLEGVWGRGAYIIRALTGVDPQEGAVRVAQPVGPGAWFCFQQRDAGIARLDLEERLSLARARDPRPPEFGFYFDCLGRGRRLYGEVGVDLECIRSTWELFPLAGMRTNAEFAPGRAGPVMHSFTGVLALFRQPQREE